MGAHIRTSPRFDKKPFHFQKCDDRRGMFWALRATLPFRDVESSSHSSKLFIRRALYLFLWQGLFDRGFAGCRFRFLKGRGAMSWSVESFPRKSLQETGLPPRHSIAISNVTQSATYQTKVSGSRIKCPSEGLRRRTTASSSAKNGLENNFPCDQASGKWM